MRFYILRPDKSHKRFRLTCFKTVDGSRITVPLNEQIKKDVLSINKQMLSGAIATAQVETLLNELITAQYRRLETKEIVLRRSSLSVINQNAFKAFWQDRYATRVLVDPRSAKYDFQAALRRIEPLSIQAATQAELQEALKKNCKNARQIRRASNRLNEIIVYLKRDFKLAKPKEGVQTVRHVNLKQFKELHKKLSKGPVQDLAMALFSAGLRISEAMALLPSDFRKGVLQVMKQHPRLSDLKPPKREKRGKVKVLKLGHKACVRWCAVEEKEQYRQALVTEMRKLGKITPHDLRHSHAIHWLSKGASLKLVANNLRNGILVCEKYYAGFEHSDDTLEGLNQFDDSSDN